MANYAILCHCDGTNGSTTYTNAGTGGTLAAVGSATLNTTNKKFGTAGSDHTVNGCILSGSSVSLGTGDFTISWQQIRISGAGGKPFCIGNEGTVGGLVVEFFVNQVNVQVTTTGGNTNIIALTGTNLGDTGTGWHHALLERKSGTIYLVVDGVTQGSVANSSSFSGRVMFGDKAVSAGTPEGGNIGGYMDELLVISDSALYTGLPTTFTPPSAQYDIPSTGSTLTAAAGVDTASTLTGKATDTTTATGAPGVSTAATLVGKTGAASSITPAAGASTGATLVGKATDAAAETPAAGTSTAATVGGAATAAGTETAAPGTSTAGTLAGSETAAASPTAAAGVDTAGTLTGTGVVPTTATPAAGSSTGATLVGQALILSPADLTAAADVDTASTLVGRTGAAAGETPAGGTSVAAGLGGAAAAAAGETAAGGATTAGALGGAAGDAAAITTAAGISAGGTLVGGALVAGQSTITPATGSSTTSTLTGKATVAASMVPAADSSTAGTLSPPGAAPAGGTGLQGGFDVDIGQQPSPRQRPREVYRKPILQRVLEERYPKVKPKKERAQRRAKNIELEAAALVLEKPIAGESRFAELARQWMRQGPALPPALAQVNPLDLFASQVAFRIRQQQMEDQALQMLAARHAQDEEDALIALLLA